MASKAGSADDSNCADAADAADVATESSGDASKSSLAKALVGTQERLGHEFLFAVAHGVVFLVPACLVWRGDVGGGVRAARCSGAKQCDECDECNE